MLVAGWLAFAAPASGGAAETEPRWERLGQPGGFVRALVADPGGAVWVGTEDLGVFRFDPSVPEGRGWTRYTTREGLGDDNAHALEVDRLGRIWAGHLNHGVSVFDGRSWKVFDVPAGPIGERIFALKCNPADGDVWMATSAGLTRYCPARDRWTHLTRSEGLPSDLAGALAFDARGDLYVGTQSDGIAVARAAKGYAEWTLMPGPAAPDPGPTGVGLPSCAINGLLVSREGRVYAATTAGLAASPNHGQTWIYLRGRDHESREPRGGRGPGGRGGARRIFQSLLPEDYVNCLAEDGEGLIWLGFRRRGVAVYDPRSGRQVVAAAPEDGLPGEYATALLPMPDGRPLIGTYSGGLARAAAPWPPRPRDRASSAPARAAAAPRAGADRLPASAGAGPAAPRWPTPAGAPTLAELNALNQELEGVAAAPPGNKAEVVSLDDDWRTQGGWIGRYGRFAAILCAMGGGGTDFVSGPFSHRVEWRGWLGAHCDRGDQLRHWVHWITTNDPRSLQNPIQGGRKQSEWDDHGEAYPMSRDGPHVYGTLKLPPGRYFLSAYLFNKDGHEGSNRFRDFLVEVRPTPLLYPTFLRLGGPDREVEAAFVSATPSARSRVRDFWGGVYKRFFINVQEPGYWTVRINRNHSFNTILSGIFVDPAGELVETPGSDRPPRIRPRIRRFPQRLPRPTDDRGELCLRLIDRLLWLRESNPLWYAQHGRRYLLAAARGLLAQEPGGTCLAARLDAEGTYLGLREDVAAALDGLQLFDHRDRVSVDPGARELFRWTVLTRDGGAQASPAWDPGRFETFLHERRRRLSWGWK